MPDGEDATPWLLVVVRNLSRNAGRRARRHGVLIEPWAEPEHVVGLGGLEDSVAAREQLLGRWRRLKEIDRELILLVAWDGLEPAQAGEVLGLRAGAARSRLHRARNQLAGLLGAAAGVAAANRDRGGLRMRDSQLFEDDLLERVRELAPLVPADVLSSTGPSALRVLTRVLATPARAGAHTHPARPPAASATGAARPPTWLTRWRVGAVAGLATVIAVLGAILVIGAGGGPSIVARAYAAINPAGVIVHYVETGYSSLLANRHVQFISEFYIDGHTSHQILEPNDPKARQDIVTSGGQVWTLAFGTLSEHPGLAGKHEMRRGDRAGGRLRRGSEQHSDRRYAQPLSVRADPRQRPRHDQRTARRRAHRQHRRPATARSRRRTHVFAGQGHHDRNVPAGPRQTRGHQRPHHHRLSAPVDHPAKPATPRASPPPERPRHSLPALPNQDKPPQALPIRSGLTFRRPAPLTESSGASASETARITQAQPSGGPCAGRRGAPGSTRLGA